MTMCELVERGEHRVTAHRSGDEFGDLVGITIVDGHQMQPLAPGRPIFPPMLAVLLALLAAVASLTASGADATTSGATTSDAMTSVVTSDATTSGVTMSTVELIAFRSR